MEIYSHTFLTKISWKQHLHYEMISRNIFFGDRISCFFTAWKNSSNQLFSNFFSKTVAFTKSLQKNVRENFYNFHTVNHAQSVEKIEIKISWNVDFTKFLWKIVRVNRRDQLTAWPDVGLCHSRNFRLNFHKKECKHHTKFDRSLSSWSSIQL